ncbi:hypothetical protein Tco_0888254 [Tanacetum coccineum]
MENQESHILKLRQPLSMLGLFSETMNTIVKNRNLMKLILCLVILTDILLEVATKWDLEPLREDFQIQISYTSIRHENSREVQYHQLMKFIMFSCCYCFYLYFKLSTISSSYKSYTGNRNLKIPQLTLGNLKSPLLTSGCIFLLTVGINLVYSFAFVVIPAFRVSSQLTSSLFSITSFVVKWICNVHVAALWTMTLVVSVLEDNISGLKAINRAGDLMIGRRMQAYTVIMLNFITCLVIRKTSGKMFLIFQEWELEEWAMWAIKTPFVIGFTSLFKILVFVFYTVLYHECNINYKEDGILHASVADKSL